MAPSTWEMPRALTDNQLHFVGAQTFAGNGTVVFGGANGGYPLYGYNATLTAQSNGDSGILTIGSGITLDGKYGQIGNSSLPLINQGTIDASGGGTLYVYGSNWSSSGTLEASGGGQLVLNDTWTNSGTIQASGGTVSTTGGALTNTGIVAAAGGGSVVMSTPPTNLSSGTLTGGTWNVGASSSMSLDASITTDAASIILGGTGANFSSLSPLAKIASGGSLEILNGGAFTTAGNLDNAGTVDLAPGTLTVTGNYTQEAGGTFDVAVGGLTAGTQVGQLKVTNQASLNGGIGINLMNGYTPPLGDSYTVLTFGSETGNFVADFGLYFGGGLGFSPTFSPSTNPTALNLAVISELAGTQTTVQSSENPSNYGDTVTFTAMETPTVSTNLFPTGSVTFLDGSTDLGSGHAGQRLGDLLHVRPHGRKTLDQRAVRRRLQLQRQQLDGSHPDCQPDRQPDRPPVVGGPLGLRRLGHVHRDGFVLVVGLGYCDTDRAGRVLRRLDAPGHRDLERRLGQLHHVGPARGGQSTDRGEVPRRCQLQPEQFHYPADRQHATAGRFLDRSLGRQGRQ